MKLKDFLWITGAVVVGVTIATPVVSAFKKGLEKVGL